MKTMNIAGREYPVIGEVKGIPLVDLPMMSPERDRQLSRENAVQNYIKEFGRQPETVQEAVDWQKEWCRAFIGRLERKQKNQYYAVCPDCGAHLDPGERCDCEEA